MIKPLPSDPTASRFPLHELAQRLRRFLPRAALLDSPEDLHPYECDGLSAYRQLPGLVALPETIEQVQHILRLCSE